MSTHNPGTPRRRRIAGERRGRALSEDQQAPLGTPRGVPPTPGPSAPAVPVATQAKGDATPGATPDATSDATPDATPGATRWWGSRASLLALSGLLVLLLALTGLVALGLMGTDSVQDVNEADAVERAVRTAPPAAEAAATAILAYDFRSLDADQDAASRLMTDEFAEEYSETFEKVVRPAAEETRAKVTASVLATSVIRATDDTARVLIFVDQTTTSTSNERPQVALNRVEMSMVREGDSWRVADISSF